MKRESKWKAENAHVYASKEYRDNRKRVMLRDHGFCVRCYTLLGKMRMDVECDHFIHIKSGEPVDNSMDNLWAICLSCHSLKTAQEANRNFNPKKPFGDNDRDDEGWNVDIDWQELIKQRNKEFGFK